MQYIRMAFGKYFKKINNIIYLKQSREENIVFVIVVRHSEQKKMKIRFVEKLLTNLFI